MFYANPCYPNYFDAYDKSGYAMSNADNISLKPYIKSINDSSSQYHSLEKIIKSNDIYLKYDFYWTSGMYPAYMYIVIKHDNGKDTLLIYSPYSSDAWFGQNKIRAGEWYNSLFHIYIENVDNDYKRVMVDASIGTKRYNGWHTDKTYSNPKIECIGIRGYQHVRDIVIADFPLHINDEVVELPIINHAGDFVDKGDGSYELTEANKVGSINIDAANAKIKNKKLLAVNYTSSITRNNDDITSVEINYAGKIDLHNLQDGANVIITSLEGDIINKEVLNQLTVTAKKV